MNKDDSPNRKASTMRWKAEEILASKEANFPEIPEGDTQALIHELRVHQIELEMQNDELREAQVTIENSRGRFSDLYDYAPVGYLTIDKTGILVEANLTASELLGYEREYLIGKPFTAFVDREDQDAFYLHLRSLREGHSHSCEIRLSRKSGAALYAQLVSVTFVNEGQAAEEILVAVSDITARRNAEEKLAIEHALTESVIESSVSPVFAVDRRYRYLCFNSEHARVMKEIFGANIAIGGNLLDYYTNADNRMSAKMNIDKALMGETVTVEGYRGEDASTQRYFATSYRPIHQTNREVIGVSVHAHDLTDRKIWEVSILDLNERLQMSNQELEILGHTLSHDLRGPLNGIIGFADILLEDCAAKLDEEHNQYLRRVSEIARNMDTMITGLLDISGIARTGVSHEKFDLSELVRSIAQECRGTQPDRDVEIVVEEGLVGEGDTKLIRIALDNLVRNAWKFTSKKPKTRIEFGVTENQGRSAFFLRDNGAGFDMKHVSKIFTVFQRLHAVSEFEGAGIGLATVARIIRRHGGEIWAEGEVGKGATFYFTLK